MSIRQGVSKLHLDRGSRGARSPDPSSDDDESQSNMSNSGGNMLNSGGQRSKEPIVIGYTTLHW